MNISHEFISRNAKRWSLLALVAFSTVCSAATSPIGRPLKIYEASPARSVYFSIPVQTCTNNAVSTCVPLNEWGFARFTDIELNTVTISGSSGRSGVCADEIGRAVYAFKGVGPEPDITSFYVTHRYEIQSAVLDNLSLINPRTGLPFNGKISLYSYGGYSDQDYFKIGQRVQRTHDVSKFDCGNPLLSYSMLVNTYGLNSFTAQYLMSQPMTIKLFVSGEVNGIDSSFYSMQIRILGD